MKQFNFIFYLFLFLGFFLPSNNNFYVPLPGVQLQIRELAFLLLPVVNLFCWSNNRVWVADRKLKTLIAWFLIIIVFTELFKHLYYDEGVGNAIKTIRIGLPLFSSLFLVYTGIRADIKKVWRTLLWAISISAVLTLISPFLFLPIYSSIDGSNVFEAAQGRLINSNSSFGILGIYLLYSDKNMWYNSGVLPKFASWLSIAVLILSFNRTYLALLIMAFTYLSFTSFSVKNALKFFLAPIVGFGVFWGTYSLSEVIQRQVDQRIFDVILGTTRLSESVFENNRDVIVEGVLRRINEGYWLFGLPYDKPFFIWIRDASTYLDFGDLDMFATDTSFVNILLRYGLVPFIFFLCIIHRLFTTDKSGLFRFSMIFFVIASLNIDSLLRHNSILFLMIVYLVVRHKIDSQSRRIML